MDGRPRASALRWGRYSEAGQVYLVTTVTRPRTPVFGDFFAARTLVQVLHLEQREARARTLAYVPGKATRAVALDLQLIFDVTRRIAREPTAGPTLLATSLAPIFKAM